MENSSLPPQNGRWGSVRVLRTTTQQEVAALARRAVSTISTGFEKHTWQWSGQWLYQVPNSLFPSESVTVKSGSGTALVKQFDIQTSDGVIHAIDTVIWEQLNTWNLPPWKFDIVIAIWRYYTSTSNGLSLHFDACEHNLGVKKKDINCSTQFKESKSSTHQQQQLYSDRRLRVLRDGNACLAYPLLIEFSLS